jgi:hypothetical protein
VFTARAREHVEIATDPAISPAFLYNYPGFDIPMQHYHMDRAFNSGVMNILLSLADGAKFSYKDANGKAVTVLLEKGDIVCFNANLEHRGNVGKLNIAHLISVLVVRAQAARMTRAKTKRRTAFSCVSICTYHGRGRAWQTLI